MANVDAAGSSPVPDARPAPGRPVYLDHAATTPMLPEALTAMTEELAQLGNPSSLHNPGRRARRVVEESRELIAEAYGARPSEVVFTSGGTEADNLAIKGLYWARRAADPARRRVLAAAAEHHAVLDSVSWLAEHEDARRTGCRWTPRGVVPVPSLAEVIERDPASGGPDQRDVGKQRGRHGAAHRRAGRGWRPSTRSRSTATPSRRPASCR